MLLLSPTSGRTPVRSFHKKRLGSERASLSICRNDDDVMTSAFGSERDKTTATNKKMWEREKMND